MAILLFVNCCVKEEINIKPARLPKMEQSFSHTIFIDALNMPEYTSSGLVN